MEKQEFRNTEIVFENEFFAMHYLEPESVTQSRPVIVVPPHAGRHGCIAQRMCETCRDAGAHTYTYELKPATDETKGLSIAGLLDIVDKIVGVVKYRRHPEIGALSGKVDMVGLCQGAWLSAVFVAMRGSDHVARYANFAGPINTKTGEENAIEKYVSAWSSVESMMDHHSSLVERNGGIQPGWAQWMAFSFVKPVAVYVERFFNLAWAFASQDPKRIAKEKRNNGWYDYTVDLAGNWFLDCLENHFGRNRLFEGEWEIDGEKVDLSRITCEVYLYAGSADDITHPEQVRSMGDAVGSDVVRFKEFEGAGHTKVFVGTKELAYFKAQWFGA
jgi:poly-beta-hydroxyalkanoate depolymerase